MIFRDPTCPYVAVVVAVVVCVDVYYILYNIIKTAHTRMIHHHSKDKLSLQTQIMYSTPFLLRVLGLLWLVLSLLGQTQDERLATHLDTQNGNYPPNRTNRCAPTEIKMLVKQKK